MTSETVAAPISTPKLPSDSNSESEKPFGIANSFSESQQRRNRQGPANPTQAGANRQVAPTPLPKRPKGRFFVGGFLLSLLLGFGYVVWSAFFSVAAHGIVEGRKLEIAPLQASVIRTIHVRDGGYVRQGDPLITVESVERDESSQVADAEEDLRNAIYDLEVEIARLRVNASLKENGTTRAKADYFQMWGEYLKEQIKLDGLIDKFRRSQQLNKRNSLGSAELRTTEFDVKGQREKVLKLGLAVEEMKANAEQAKVKIDLSELVQAHFSRIENFRQKLSERKTVSDPMTVIRAPVSGKVIRIERFTGERIAAGEKILDLVEDGSRAPILYLKQSQTSEIKVGQTIQISIEPDSRLIQCEVEEIGDEYVEIPDGLKRKITEKEHVIPVRLRPCDPEMARDLLRLGATIEFPRQLPFVSMFAVSQDPPSAANCETPTEDSESEAREAD